VLLRMTRTTTDVRNGLARYGLTINQDGEVVPAAGTEAIAEFVDVAGMYRCFGMKRSLCYELLARGLIKGVSLRQPGSIKGKRLFHVASVREYLQSQMTVNHPSRMADKAKQGDLRLKTAARPR
jgi:hypothetical protein